MPRFLFITMHRLIGHGGGCVASRSMCHIISAISSGKCKVVASQESAPIMDTIPHENFVPVATRGLLQKAFYFLLTDNSDRFTPYVNRHLDALLGDVSHVFLDGSMIGRFAKLFKKHSPHIHVTLLHHNFERAYYANTRRGFLNGLVHNRIIDKNQGTGWKYADLNLVFTPKDLKDISKYYGVPGVRAEVFGYYEPISPSFTRQQPPSNQLRIVITGDMSVPKGYKGVVWFLNNVWGSVDSTKYKLIIAGRNPIPELRIAASTHPNVDVIANPEDMTKVLCDADIFLNPCNIGSGIKIRNMDGLRSGLPTLCRRGNEHGFESLPPNVFAVFEDEHDFIDKLNAVTPRNHSDVRDAYINHFSLHAGVEHLRKLLSTM